jgi:hypothetical protein
MADQSDGRALVLNNLLCFLIRKYNILDEKCLKSLVSAFYSPVDIEFAKKELLRYVLKMEFDRPFTRFPTRLGTGRVVKEVDDIVDIVKELDERKHLDALPRFVTDDIDKAPSVQFNEGDVRFLLNKMDKMEASIQSLQTTVYTLVARLDEKFGSSDLGVINKIQQSGFSQQQPRPQAMTGLQPPNSGKTTTSAINVNMAWSEALQSSRSLVQPSLSMQRPSVSEVETVSNDDNLDGFTPYESRQRRRKKRRLQQSSTDGRTDNTAQSKTNSYSKPLIVGKLAAGFGENRQSLSVVAAKPLKVVYCVDNVSPSITDVELKMFVESLGVRVVTCFEVKARLSAWQRKRQIQPNRKAFRLCINRADNKQLLNAELWPEDISISKWFFKPPVEAVNTDEAGSNISVLGGSDANAATSNLVGDMDATIIESDRTYSFDQGMKSTP